MAKWKVKVSHGLDNQQHEVLAIEAVHAPSPLDGDRLDSLSVEEFCLSPRRVSGIFQDGRTPTISSTRSGT